MQLKTARTSTVDVASNVLLREQRVAQERVQARRDDEEEGRAELLARGFRDFFPPAQEVLPPRPKAAVRREEEVANASRSIRHALESVMRQGSRILAVDVALGLELPDKAGFRRWQGVPDSQRGQVLGAVDKALREDVPNALSKAESAMAKGFLQATKLAAAAPTGGLGAAVERLYRSAASAQDVLLGIDQRAASRARIHAAGLPMGEFDPSKEALIRDTIAQREEAWKADRLRDTHADLVAGGFELPLEARTGPINDRIKATLDFTTGFLASAQGPALESVGVPSLHDLMNGQGHQIAAERLDPRVAPGFVVSPKMRESFERFARHYHQGDHSRIERAMSEGQAALREVTLRLQPNDAQVSAMQASAQHTAAGIFTGGDALRLALFVDSQRSVTTHEVDEFESWRVGSPEAVHYAKTVQSTLGAAAEGNLADAQDELLQAFERLRAPESGALFLAGLHPLAVLGLAMGQPRREEAREYRGWLEQLPVDPNYAAAQDRRTNAYVDAEQKNLIQFGRDGSVRVYGFASGLPERLYQGDVEGAPIQQRLGLAHQDAKDALNRDQVVLTEAIRLGYLSLDNMLERPVMVSRLRPDAALALDGYNMNEDDSIAVELDGDAVGGLEDAFRIELDEGR